MSRGLFLAIEGPEGAGKTTQREFIAQWFRNEGFRVVVTREPGGTPLAEEIREILLRIREEKMASDTELLLMFAARAQHVEEVIKPNIENGSIVICDRFVDSSYAYQCGGRGIPYERLQELEKWTLKGFHPDVTFYFDIPLEVGLSRIASRGKLDRFEEEGMEFFRNVAKMYRRRYDENKDRCVLVNANQTMEAVSESMIPALLSIANKIHG